MHLKNELDLVPGIYKCYGEVDNLKFKVRLEIIKSSMIPLSNVEDQDSGLDPQYYEREELEFSWNEKIFSDREHELYNDERNCTTTVEREYHDRIKSFPSSGVKPSSHRLYTYTSRDHVPAKLHRNVLYDGNKNKYFLNKAPLCSQKLNSATSVEMFDNKHLLPVRNIVDSNPSAFQRRRNRSLSPDNEIMYVVANLSDESKKREHEEEECTDYLLFTIMWNKRTLTLSVMPDFAIFSTAGYKIDVDHLSDTRYVYRYWLLNESPAEDPASRNIENLDEQVMAHQNLNFPLDFQLPREDMCHLFAFVELQKIEGFQGESLFVRYFMSLPSKWNAENPEFLYGVTHQCRPRKIDNVASFSSVFEVKLFHDNILSDEERCSQQVNVPQMFFEVCSLDSWKRFRIEGYAWMPFPTDIGHHEVVLSSWRPILHNRSHELRRFFVGADSEIAGIEYCGLTSESKVLARYGFDTIATGSIHLLLNTVRQTCPSTTKPKKMMYSSNSWKTNKLMNNVNNILEAFKKARQRMLSVRKPISVSDGRNGDTSES